MRKHFPTLLAAGLAAAAFTTSTQALAYGAGDFFTRLGVAKVAPKSDNGNLDTALGNLAVDVQDDTNFAFTLGYRFHDNVGVELLAALPFEHDINLDGQNLASTKHLPPTLTVQYYPLGGTAALVQPYVGVGINYTRFSSEKLDIDGIDLDLSSSWGAAGQVGVDVLIDDNWALNAAAWYIDIETDASLNGTEVGTVKIDPWVIMGGISYRF
ncbi:MULTISPECIES: OmpW/AlkL family protein [Halomonas]|uniref:OmpW family outer membrane protein n=1 Tax=Halomonas mongoliensis TaxID=321265 RepID=A0ABU1GRL6_9GAMM|nr:MULTISPECIES: OmpW family outer membrane protein [Halomonas]MDR5894043.1 OmpW family outer membrane protein [Halomonas mongoliensis]PWV70860.1 outer membrane protein [Halomonas sp. A11-A]